MRGWVYSVVCVVLLLALGVRPVGAVQEATPEGGLDALGLPTLDVTVTAEGFEGIPETFEAGRYLVTVTAAEDIEPVGALAFVQPVGVGVDEFRGAITGPPPDGASPAAEGGSTPASDEASVTGGDVLGEGTPASGGDAAGGPPAFIFEAIYAGGTFTDAGQSAQVVLDLGPGEWIAWADGPHLPQEPLLVEVAGEMPADLPEPDAEATLTVFEYDIKLSEGALVAGPQVVKVENVGAQPHFLFLAPGPDRMIEEQVGIALQEEMEAGPDGEPVFSDLSPLEDLGEGPGTGTQSMGTTTWHVFDLEAAPSVLVCFFPDLADGLPHAFHGMYEVVEVSG